MSTLYVSPTGAGTKDGSSLANAATINGLSTLIAKAGPGGSVLLIADQGVYQVSSQISITAGGTSGSPVTIRGIDSHGVSMDATIIGTRDANWTAGAQDGNEIFRLLTGANNLSFADLAFKNVGNGAFRVGADISNIQIQHVTADNVARFFSDVASGSNTSASVTGLLINDVAVHGFSKGAIELAYGSNNVKITNVTGDSGRQDGDNFAIGIHLEDQVHDVLIQQVTMNNSTDTTHAYWNGDGFATEAGVKNVSFIDTSASGNTDAGYDLKSTNTTLLRASASDNKYNYRFWSDSITLQDSTGSAPNHRGGTGGEGQVWLAEGAVAKIINSSFSGGSASTTVFDLSSANAKLILDGAAMVAATAATTAKVGTGSSIVQQGDLPTNGADSLHGTTGADKLAGGLGDDSYYVDNAGDTVTEAKGGGNDSVFSTVSFSLVGQDIENLTLTGSASINAVGNALANTLTGNSGANSLDGGAGNDKMVGGAGDDTYIVDSYSDVVVEELNGGNDTISTTLASYSLAGTQVETLQYAGAARFSGTGSAGADTIIGGKLADSLNGGAGADTLVGGLGDDVYLVDNAGDRTVEAVNAGTDTVRASVSYSLADNVENLEYTGTAAAVLTGNGLANSITGGAGADKIDGLGGADIMAGNEGDDTYVVDNAGDLVKEGYNAGTDTVITTLSSYTLGSNVENLAASGSGALTGTGNQSANWITGGSAADVLSGLAGDDVLTGNGGADRLIGGLGADTFVFKLASDSSSSAADTIADFSSAQHDQIDLSSIDANSILAGDQAFAFIGTAAFSHHAGELRYMATASGLVVMGDVNGDGIADFSINLTGAKSLAATDFHP